MRDWLVANAVYATRGNKQLLEGTRLKGEVWPKSPQNCDLMSKSVRNPVR